MNSVFSKITIIICSIVIAYNGISQSVQNKHFSLDCNCQTINEEFNESSKRFDYEYFDIDNEAIYSIGVFKTTMDENSKSAFLEAIKNSQSFDFEYETFLGENTLTFTMNVDDGIMKTLHFFKNEQAFTLIIYSEDISRVNNAYSYLKTHFKPK